LTSQVGCKPSGHATGKHRILFSFALTRNCGGILGCRCTLHDITVENEQIAASHIWIVSVSSSATNDLIDHATTRTEVVPSEIVSS